MIEGQVELAGVLLGPGTDFVIESFNPWVFPQLDAGEVGRSGRHGVHWGRDLRRIKRVPLQLTVNCYAADTAVAEMHRVLATATGPTTLRFQQGGATYQLEGRVRLAEPSTDWIWQGAVPIELRFEADPFVFSDDEHSASTGFPTGGVGRTYDLEFPRVYGAAGSGGSILVSNAGTADAPWSATITGPWVNPTIRDVVTGDELRLSISLGPGDVLELDSSDESVFLGSAHRLNAVLPGSVWPQIRPGESEWRIGGASGSGVVSVRWRDAWL